MEKPHVEEKFEQEQNQSTQVDVSKLSPQQIQAGIEANVEAATRDFINHILKLEEIIGKKIKINLNAHTRDGRRLHIRVRESKGKV